MSRKVEVEKFLKKAEEVLDRPLEKKEKQCIEVAYDAGIKDVDDAIDFADCVYDRGEDTNPYELISDYMALLY